MTSQKLTCEIRCDFAWWFKPYLSILRVFVLVTRRVPSDEHFEWIARKAVRTTVVTASVD